jgi:hypothetical protein
MEKRVFIIKSPIAEVLLGAQKYTHANNIFLIINLVT